MTTVPVDEPSSPVTSDDHGPTTKADGGAVTMDAPTSRPPQSRLCPACGTRTTAGICPADGTTTLDVPQKTERPDPYLGRVIADRYRIVGLLGEGGMGRVYSAVQLALGQQVAIKVLLPDKESSETSVKRFHREARATTLLHNPHVVRVYDFGIDAVTGAPYLVMEYLRGRTVHDLLRARGPMPLKRAVGITAQVLRALVEAEDQSLVHRDIKPENLFLVETGDDTDFVKVMDFGVARTVSGVADGLGSVTVGGNIVGTPAYMSPEQVSGKPTTTRSDLYSVGCLLHELVCAERPYADSGDSVALMVAHVTRPPPQLPSETPHGEPVFEALHIVHAALLRKSPDDRPRSARLALAALQAILDNRPDDVATILGVKGRRERLPAEAEPPGLPPEPEVKPPPALERDADPAHPRRRRPGVVGAVALLTATAIALVSWSSTREEPALGDGTESPVAAPTLPPVAIVPAPLPTVPVPAPKATTSSPTLAREAEVESPSRDRFIIVLSAEGAVPKKAPVDAPPRPKPARRPPQAPPSAPSPVTLEKTPPPVQAW